MSSNMEMEVSFMPGTSIEDALVEAKAKAIMWDVAYVIFKFNEISVNVSQYASVQGLTKQYVSAVSTGRQSIID